MKINNFLSLETAYGCETVDLSKIYYYFLALAMMAFVQIASFLKLDVDLNSNGRLCINRKSSNLIPKSYKKGVCSNFQFKQK